MNTAKFYDLGVARQQRSNRVENQKLGFIPLYRSIKNKSWAKDVYLRALWENLLLEAQSEPYTANYKGHIWHLKAGQLVTTPANLGLNLCDRNGKPTSRDTVNRMLAVFVREGMISIEGEKHKGTVITITNYSDYVQNLVNVPAHKYAHNNAHDEASVYAHLDDIPAHNNAHEPAHHEQYIFNNKLLNDRPRKKSSVPRKVKPDAVVSSEKGDKWGNADDLKAAQWIYSQVLIVSPSTKEPNWSTWANDIRLMRQLDGHAHQDICRMFKWANRDSFWCSNVLSPAKLREKWDTLVIQSQQPNRKPAISNQISQKPKIDFDDTKWMEGVDI